MPNPPWMVNIAVPAEMRDFIAAQRIHPRQAYHEIIGRALNHESVGSTGVKAPRGPGTGRAPPRRRDEGSRKT